MIPYKGRTHVTSLPSLVEYHKSLDNRVSKTKKIHGAVVEKGKTERLCTESIDAECEGKTSLSKHWQSILQQLRLATPFCSVRTLFPCATLCKDDARIKRPPVQRCCVVSGSETTRLFVASSGCHPPSGTRSLPQISSRSATCPTGTSLPLALSG